MRKSEWSDKQLEDLLRSMPKIEDNRNPREIYQNVALNLNKKKQRSWIVPSVATAAAILIFVILTPNFMSWSNSAEESMDKSTASKSTEQVQVKDEGNERALVDSSEENDEIEENVEIEKKDSEEEMKMASFEVEESYTAVYNSDIINENVFTFAIPDTIGQNIVPVSLVVSKEEGKTAIEQLQGTMLNLQEEEWGLSDYYPLNAVMSLDENTSTLNVNVPTDHIYRDGSTSELAFKEMLKITANTLGLEKVSLYTDSQPGIVFGNQGNMTDLDVADDGNHAYYFYYPKEDTQRPFLVPYSETFNDIEAALDAMKDSIATHGLKASIPEDFNINEVTSSGEQVLTLQLDESSTLVNEPSMIYTIEAILLTAKDFEYEKVKIEYNKIDAVGKFPLNQELDVPVAPNKMELLH